MNIRTLIAISSILIHLAVLFIFVLMLLPKIIAYVMIKVEKERAKMKAKLDKKNSA
jgi:hypothetical protein